MVRHNGEIHKIKGRFCVLNGRRPLIYGEKYITYGV